MASSSFQNITIADYMRILFQRLWIIVICVIIAVSIASYFAVFNMQKRYQSSMDIRVFRKHSRNPFLKMLLTSESLNEVITDLRDRLQGEKRLRLFAMNLRLKVKNEYIKNNHLDKYSLSQAEAVSRILRNLSREERINIFSKMELVTCAKILGLIDPVNIYPFQMINGTENLANSEYLVNENNEFFIKKLRKAVANKKELQSHEYKKILIEKVRDRIAIILDDIIKDKNKFQKLDKKQLWEIHKELLSIDRLIEVGLYAINTSKKAQNSYVANLRGGLEVGITGRNFIHLLFDSAHPSIKQAVPHLIVFTAYEMFRAEYYAQEEGHRLDAKNEMHKQVNNINHEILEINKQLANHKNLVKLQIAYADNPSATYLEDETRPEFFATPRVSTHIKKLNLLGEEKRNLEGEIEAKYASIKELEETLRNPDKVRIVQKTIKMEKTPESRRLQIEKNKKIEELRRLRLDSTEKHPRVQKLMQEIQQINLSLSGLNSPIETTVEKEHPMVSQWKAQKIIHKQEIAVLKARISKIEKSIKVEMDKAIEAPKRLQKYEALRKRKSTLSQMLNVVQTGLEKVISEENIGKGLTRTVFEIYRSPIKPSMHYAPKVEIIVLIGFIIGILAALAAIFIIEYTDHSIKGIEDAKRYFDIPILGTIPEFEFQIAEDSHIRRSILLRKLMGRDSGESVGASDEDQQVITTKKSKYMMTVILFSVVTILMLGAAFIYMKRKGINNYYQEIKYELMNKLDMNTDGQTSAPENENIEVEKAEGKAAKQNKIQPSENAEDKK
ncbi:MAG: GumC domain-containing protein [Planctomycetota bacterium]|jgi:capsular polysaccharide biosynthesis protein